MEKFALSFSGCGFLGIYHFGSVSAFLKHSPSFLNRCSRVAGASAGSLIAALLVICPEKIDDALKTLYKLSEEVNSMKFGALTNGYSLISRVESLIDDALPSNSDELASKKLFVSLTRLPSRTNCLVSEFSSRQHLIQCLLASCYIPLYAGSKQTAPIIDGEQCIDGGLTNNLPKFSDVRTITVSPFCCEADICSKDEAAMFDWTMTLGSQIMKVNYKNFVRGGQALFPPNKRTLDEYYCMGYRDAMKFLIENNFFEREEGTEV